MPVGSKKKEKFVIDCPNCEVRVEAKFVAEKIIGDDYPDITRYVFLTCPSCLNPLFISQDWGYSEHEGEIWYDPKRLWPGTEKVFSLAIPKIVRDSLVEAKKCYEAKTYMACAVMCG